MNLIRIYQCLCNRTRLRILNLLHDGELCVCHIQEILGEPQVKISKHLAYLRKRGLVASRKKANWIIYRLPARQSGELSANLSCLQDCAREHPVFRADTARLRRLMHKIEKGPECCPSPRAPARAAGGAAR